MSSTAPETMRTEPESATPPELYVNRHETHFNPAGANRVRFEVTLHNVGDERSPATVTLLESAPLGAFVPWQPLAVLPVPSLDAGQSHRLEFEAARPHARLLGPPDRVPPHQLLTALDPGDRPRRRNFSELVQSWTGSLTGTSEPTLPTDLMELFHEGQPNWAGNLNIFVEGKAVERHRAGPLRIQPNCVNLALLVVGSGRDVYRFNIRCSHDGWQAGLFNMSDSPSPLADPGKNAPLALHEWIEIPRMQLMNLAIRPPSHCIAGSVDVEVEQRSSQEVAVVEFSLDPQAAGPGCYTL